MPEKFVHLHVHTEFSMLDGAAKHDELFAEVNRLGQPAVAMTDHGNMYGAHAFHAGARKAGVTPIIGIEAYVAPASRHHKKPVFWGQRASTGKKDAGGEGGGDVSGAGAYTHMTMLAKNSTGLRNLFRLSSLASMEGYFRKPRMDKELIAEHAEGIVATSGCLAGEVLTRIKLGQKQEALQAASDYRDIFGPDNFYIEVMDHNIAFERQLRDDLLDVARTLNLKTVATNDSHYVTADQAQHHDALLCLQTRATLADTDRFSFSGDPTYYVRSSEEMRSYWDTEVPGAADATLEILDKVEGYDDAFGEVDRKPQAKSIAGKSDVDQLRDEIEHFIPTRFPDGFPDEYRERLETELHVITKKGYSSYFLVVGDMIRWAKQQGARVGPGRGSAAGALLSYILHIIDIDPLEYGLIFERFLNLERDSPPDIDIDFDEASREPVIQYAKDKYGQDYFAKVVTYNTIKTKAAFKDAARVHLGQPGFALADQFSKALPSDDMPLDAIVDPEHEQYTAAAEVRSLIENDPTTRNIYETARGLDGLVRSTGVHPCAHIISSEQLLDVLPLWRRDDGEIITGWDGKQCEKVGLLKIDILGVSNLTIIDDAVRMIAENYGTTIDTLALPRDDADTFGMLARGDTLGVFQFEGGGMQGLLKRLVPTEFGDMVAANSLYRPGPMDVNAHLDYADRKNRRKPVEPIHPELADALEPILGDTYGLIVYQEQVMAIAQQLAGYSLGRADVLRDAMGKKKKHIIDEEHPKFLDGMQASGFSREAAQALWDVILPFAGYAFNKSHAAAYSLVAYWTAYLKCHYPAEFMAALLTTNSDNKDKTALYLSECRKLGLDVLTPEVNESGVWFSARGREIRFGLGAIRNVGTGVAEKIIQARAEKGTYRSFTDFLSKIDSTACAKRVVEALIKAGAFDAFEPTRQSLNAVHEEAVEAMSGLKKAEAMGQFDLFGGGDDSAAPASDDTSPLAHLTFPPDEWPRKQLLAYEREMLGLYVSAHPLGGAEGILRKAAKRPIATLLHDAPTEGEATIAGLITNVDRRITKKGEPWAIVTVEDLDASIECLFFPKSYGLFGPELLTDSAVAVKGRINWRDDAMSIFASDLATLDISSAEHNPTAAGEQPFVLHADAYKIDKESVLDLCATLEHYPGPTPVHVVIIGQNKTRMTLPDHPVNVCIELVGELKGLRGITVAADLRGGSSA